jgi:peroxiredoxin 2/4
MKRRFVFIALLLLSICELKSQEKRESNIPMIGQDAPKFFAESTSGALSFPDDYGQHWKILFSHPRDFTPVCSSEILQLARMQNEFEQLGTNLVIISTDFLSSHYKWKKELEGITSDKFEPVKISFPLVADDHFVISKRYGMMHKSASTTQTVRGVFFINPANKIAAFAFYPMNIGRNLEDIKSTLLSLQSVYK